MACTVGILSSSFKKPNHIRNSVAADAPVPETKKNNLKPAHYCQDCITASQKLLQVHAGPIQDHTQKLIICISFLETLQQPR